ncbi:MAG: alpha/beta hydrolase [Hyphomicrobiales bacterium]|nr:alpha/beta hydrolase [Hyphomicrobiales bacterium]MDE2017821.1 alpha/beta hydrolase [Hyphomicrobiales bacterium]
MSDPARKRKPIVLVHGSWHGGWCWRHVAGTLRARGHDVFAPTLTGLGERAHLLTRDVSLETFFADVIGVIEAEELRDVALVGHSFGGLVATGVADRIASRLSRLALLDGVLLEPGEALADIAPAGAWARRVELAQRFSGGLTVPPPAPAAFGVFDPAQAAWLERRLTPHPFRTMCEPLRLSAPVGAGLPKTYVASTKPDYPFLATCRARAKADPGWDWREIATGHDAMVSAPEATAALIAELAEG